MSRKILKTTIHVNKWLLYIFDYIFSYNAEISIALLANEQKRKQLNYISAETLIANEINGENMNFVLKL